jgi:hypothetical protein
MISGREPLVMPAGALDEAACPSCAGIKVLEPIDPSALRWLEEACSSASKTIAHIVGRAIVEHLRVAGFAQRQRQAIERGVCDRVLLQVCETEP